MKNIKGFIDTSFIDWPGRSCAVLFLGGCNFRCPFCHNHPLVINPENLASFSLPEIMEKLKPLQKWLGGICISGGEPTLDPALQDLMSLLQQEGYELKIDTNGSNPEKLEMLLNNNLLQMISMDVKAPLVQAKYDQICGTAVNLGEIIKSINLIKKSGIRHEFRMTVLPSYHTEQDISDWVQQLGKNSKLRLQNFKPDSVLNSTLAGAGTFKPEYFRKLEKIAAQSD